MKRSIYLSAALAALTAACNSAPVGTGPVTEPAEESEDGIAQDRDRTGDSKVAKEEGRDIADPSAPFTVTEPRLHPPQVSRGTAGIAYSHASVRVDGDIARTVVTEVLVNDLDSEVEATFTRPLPDDAAVTGFAEWRNGERMAATVAGKNAARETYDRAISRGERAALAEENQGRKFAMKLSPIEPRGRRRVELSYTQTLTGLGGERTYVFPANRFATDLPTLLDVEVELVGTRAIAAVNSLNHGDARVTRLSDTRYTVHLSRTRHRLASDLVIRWNQPADDFDLAARAVRVAPGDPGFVEARFAFNRDPWASERRPVNAVLVVDSSLSMAGEPLARAQELAAAILDGLGENDRGENDRVALVSFASDVRATALQPAVGEHRSQLESELSSLVASGHSNLVAALDEAADLLRGQEGGLLVLMSDGQPTVGDGVGDDPGSDLGAARTGDFAGARVVIAHFNYPTRKDALEKLFPAASRRYIPDGKGGDDAIAALARLAVAPVIEDFSVEVAGAADETVHGAVPTRLARGESLRIMARADQDVVVQVRGKLRGRPIDIKKTVTMPAAADEAGDRGLPVEWARLRIREFETRYKQAPTSELAQDIRELGTGYGLATRFTSFVRTDSLAPDRIKPGDPEIRVHAPLSSLSVYAVMPWGEIVACEWQDDEGLWLGRFLVPRGTPDGFYRVRVFVKSQAGTALRSTLFYRIDSKPPTFTLDATYSDGVLSLTATPVEHVFDRSKNGDDIRLSHVDLRSISVRVGDRDVPLARSEELTWTAAVPMALAPGRHSLHLVARDWAANSSRATKEIEIAR